MTLDDFKPQKAKFLVTELGTLVQVRPCPEQYQNKTYIGIYLGEAIIGFYKDGDGNIHAHRNPLIFIPEMRSYVFGCESWWGEIKSEDELRQITDKDIQDIWYVKLLKAQLAEAKETQ